MALQAKSVGRKTDYKVLPSVTKALLAEVVLDLEKSTMSLGDNKVNRTLGCNANMKVLLVIFSFISVSKDNV